MALTGLPDRALGPPAGLVEGLERLGRSFAGLDAPRSSASVLRSMGLWRRGAVSCGELPPLAVPGPMVAVSLPRDEDIEAVPAWLELDVPARHGASNLDGRRSRLSPTAILTSCCAAPAAGVAGGRRRRRPRPPGGGDGSGLGAAPGRAASGALSSSTCPRCGPGRCAATCWPVRARGRQGRVDDPPDGARRGHASFFDLLNGRKRSVAFDFGTTSGSPRCAADGRADVVIEASRPRGARAAGIVAADVVREGGPQVWVSITGYGRERWSRRQADAARRVGFGDDGGRRGARHLVRVDGAPLFCADAVADPITGLTAAHECLHVARGRRPLAARYLDGRRRRRAGRPDAAGPGVQD